MQNWDETLLSQYAASPTLSALIESLNDAIDPSVDLQNLYTNLFDISTAVGQGLKNWGQIVGVSQYLTVTATQVFLGFAEAHVAGDNLDSLGAAPMSPGAQSTQTLKLTDDAYRQLILVKALANICDMTAPSLNKLICAALGLTPMGSSRAYTQDTGAMSQRYVLEFNPTPYQMAILLSSGVVPRSSGVAAWVLVAPPTQTFGFAEAGAQATFGEGTMLSNSGLTNASQ